MSEPIVRLEELINTVRGDVFLAMSREREYQKDKWGDLHRDSGAWLLIMQGELEEAIHAWRKETKQNVMCEVLQVMTVGLAMIEQHGLYERE